MRAISVLLVDDHPVVLEGLRAIVDGCQGIYVVGAARSGAEALQFLEWLVPDIVLLDLELPDMNGIHVVEWIRRKELATRILVLSAYDSPAYVRSLMDMGIDGFLVKDEAETRIEESIREAYYGEEPFFSRSVRGAWYQQQCECVEGEELTDREMEVACYLTKGWTNRKIAEYLGISEKTVEKHMQGIFQKLGVHSRVMAAVEVVRRGLVEEDVGHEVSARSLPLQQNRDVHINSP